VIYTPRPYGALITDHIIENPRCGVWASMGMGKTVGTLTALSSLLLVEDGPVLVVAPLRVARSTWPDECRKFDHIKHLRCMPIVGNVKDRTNAARVPADIYTTNYENLPWLVEFWGDKWPYKILVLDESTKVKSFRTRQGGVRAKALGSIAHTKVKRLIELTGTPAPAGLQSLWGQMWFLDIGARLGKSYTAFTDRWFRTDFNGYGLRPLPGAQVEIQDKIKDLCLTVDAKDWFDIKDPIVNNMYIDLPPRARKHYNDMEKEMFMALESGHEVEAFNAASRTIKCLQIASGATYVGNSNIDWEELHDGKIQALESIVEEASGMPVLVAYHFKSDLSRLQKAFPAGRVLDSNPATIDDWNSGRVPVLFAHPQSAGHGLNLQDGGNILVYFSHWWSLEERMQIAERIGPTRQMQAGYDRPVFVHNIIARDTVDELVIERVNSKRDVQEILLEAMKKKAFI
jgi:SNF2 family DNA or RNA helicase